VTYRYKVFESVIYRTFMHPDTVNAGLQSCLLAIHNRLFQSKVEAIVMKREFELNQTVSGQFATAAHRPEFVQRELLGRILVSPTFARSERLSPCSPTSAT
jgi:hypothetical protein